MQRALALAESAIGHSSPNPAVGAVIVRDGVIVGEGHTQQAGGEHAEVMALRDAAEQAHGATMYVTLEPCAHHGKTPPCTDAIIKAGVSHLFYAVGDPNPLVNGKGCQHLQSAGISVHNSVGQAEATAHNRAFFKYIQTGLPLVTAKFASSLDGKIATRTGNSQWISNKRARLQGHLLRQKSDAILVGANTVLDDNPSLTMRHPDIARPAHPTRIVVDSTGRVPADFKVYGTVGRAIAATTDRCPVAQRELLTQKGVEVLVLETDGEGRVSLPTLLAELGKREITSLMVEGGGQILGSMFAEQLVDRVYAFIAPMIIGGETSPTSISGFGVDMLVDAPRLRDVEINDLDGTIWIQGSVDYGSADDK